MAGSISTSTRLASVTRKPMPTSQNATASSRAEGSTRCSRCSLPGVNPPGASTIQPHLQLWPGRHGHCQSGRRSTRTPPSPIENAAMHGAARLFPLPAAGGCLAAADRRLFASVRSRCRRLPPPAPRPAWSPSPDEIAPGTRAVADPKPGGRTRAEGDGPDQGRRAGIRLVPTAPISSFVRSVPKA